MDRFELEFRFWFDRCRELEKINMLLRELLLSSCKIESAETFSFNVFNYSEHKMESVTYEMSFFAGILSCECNNDSCVKKGNFQIEAVAFSKDKSVNTELFFKQWQEEHPGKFIWQIKECSDGFASGFLILYTDENMGKQNSGFWKERKQHSRVNRNIQNLGEDEALSKSSTIDMDENEFLEYLFKKLNRQSYIVPQKTNN